MHRYHIIVDTQLFHFTQRDPWKQLPRTANWLLVGREMCIAIHSRHPHSAFRVP